MDITDLLTAAVHAGASDLHLKVGGYPMMRVHGELCPTTEERRLDPTTLNALAAELVPMGLQSRFVSEHEVDFAYSVAGLRRVSPAGHGRHGTPGDSDAGQLD